LFSPESIFEIGDRSNPTLFVNILYYLLFVMELKTRRSMASWVEFRFKRNALFVYLGLGSNSIASNVYDRLR